LLKYLLGIAVIFTLLSCRSNRPIVVADEATGYVIDSVTAVDVINKKHAFKTLKVKRMAVEFNVNGIRDNVKGSLAVSRDSLIIISVVPLLGYEVLRILCTGDSIIIINRVDKTYHASSLESYLRRYNIAAGYDEIQAVLINEPFYYNVEKQDRTYRERINLEDERISYFIESVMNGIKLTSQIISAKSDMWKITDVRVNDYMRNMRMNIRYEGFSVSKKKAFPDKILIELKERNNTINLDMEYGQILFDEKINAKFSIPEKYQRIVM
jgi:hypothetical protein